MSAAASSTFPARVRAFLYAAAWTLPREVERALLDYEGEVAALGRLVREDLPSLGRRDVCAAVDRVDRLAGVLTDALRDSILDDEDPRWVRRALAREGVDEARLADYVAPYRGTDDLRG